MSENKDNGSKRLILNAGDVLCIPVNKDLCARAKILIKKNILFISVSSGLEKCDVINVENFDSSAAVLAGWTMDAKIFRGDWKVVGRSSLGERDHIKLEYLVEYSGQTWVQDFSGKLLHPASPDEITKLFYKSSYSPVRFERAIRAYNKLEPWDDEFNDLLVKNGADSSS